MLLRLSLVDNIGYCLDQFRVIAERAQSASIESPIRNHCGERFDQPFARQSSIHMEMQSGDHLVQS